MNPDGPVQLLSWSYHPGWTVWCRIFYFNLVNSQPVSPTEPPAQPESAFRFSLKESLGRKVLVFSSMGGAGFPESWCSQTSPGLIRWKVCDESVGCPNLNQKVCCFYKGWFIEFYFKQDSKVSRWSQKWAWLKSLFKYVQFFFPFISTSHHFFALVKDDSVSLYFTGFCSTLWGTHSN